jgi:hypothetical protein
MFGRLEEGPDRSVRLRVSRAVAVRPNREDRARVPVTTQHALGTRCQLRRIIGRADQRDRSGAKYGAGKLRPSLSLVS